MGLKWFERCTCSSWDIWLVLPLFEFLEFHGEFLEFVNTDCSFEKMKQIITCSIFWYFQNFLVLLVSNLPVKLSWWSPDAVAAPPPTPLSCRMRRIVRAVCPCLPRWRWSRPWGRRWRRWVRRAPSSGPWSQRWSPVPRWRRSRWSRPSERRRWNWRPSTSRTSACHADRTDLKNKNTGSLCNSDLSRCRLS